MLNDSQQRKALVLSLLMVMLAQTAYIEAYRGWKPPVELQEEETDVLRVGSPAVCSAASRTSGTAIHVDVAQGDDTYPGTSNCPKASLGAAVTLAASESASNPEIVLHAGLYHENVSVNNLDNLLIRAATGERVVFDGTRSITDDLGGVWGSADSGGIQEVTLTEDGWQLFLAHEEQVPARWPNAGFDDETVFNRSYWAEGTLTNSNNAYTKGWLTDAGPEAGVHTGLNETVNATGLDPVGAIAVMNLGSFRSNSRIITDWNPNNGTFAYDGDGVGWKTKHHAYFLEGKRELIDQDGEWWFNNTNNRLHYKSPSGQDANNLDLRVKVQPFAISVDGSDGVTIQGIDFFGTTVNFNNCDGCSFTNSTLQYPSTSKRGLGIAGESEDDRWMTRFYRSKNSFVDRISITNTDGGAIEFQGSPGQSHNNTVNNSYFHAIDWSAADQKGLMVTIYEGGRDMYFTNNTVHLTGASSVLSIGDAPKVFYNEVWDVGHLQTDGAVVQVMQAEAPGAEIAYNWIHDVIKYGARFDAPINEVGEGMNGTMHHNVIWNAAGGLMVKGDYHDIHNNTVFNSTGKNDIIFLTDGGINNKNSTLHYNAVDAMADHRSDDIFANPIPYGTDWMNWNGYIQGKQDAVTTLHDEISSNVHYGNTCIINSTKSLLCWGYNANGRLGLGNTTDQYSPVAVTFPNAGTVEKVAESGGFVSHNCAIMTNGSLYCWGKNSNGELGINSTTDQTTPQLVNLGSGVKAVDVSVGDDFTCAVTDAGALMCWGTNGNGRLGIGSTSSTSHLTPQNANLPTNRKAVDVTLGRHFGYALLDNGEFVSWGNNHVGYLGTGNTTTMYSPTVISLDSQRQVVSISGGKQHGCIGYDNGSVVCAGRDHVGQQGRNTASETNDLTFSYTNALANLSLFALAGQYTSCALLANGTAQCWGKGNYGQMGDGTTDNNHYPDDLVNTPSGRFIVDMSLSGSHACIVLDDGSVACWGNNNKGQLGLGNTTQQNQPVVLTGLDDLSTTSVHEMLVDPANNDFRPKWGSHLHVLNAGAYAADDADPWTAGISWTYTTPSAPVAGCMLDYADNYDADATLSDGSCLFASYTPPSTLDLRLHLDPTNSSSYSGSGTNVADLSGFNNNGTVASAGPTWDADFTRFTYDGACTGSGPYVCDEIEIEDSETLRPGEPYEDLAVELNQGSTTQYLAAPTTLAGYTLGAVETSFTIQAWVKPTDCENPSGAPTILSKVYSFKIGCDDGTWQYVLGNGTAWYTGTGWVDTDVPADNNVWQHVALTRASSSTGVKFFLNGVQSYSVSSYEGDLGNNNNQSLYVGSRSGQYATSDAWHGLIDDVRIYTSDRTSTIAVDMNVYPNVDDQYLNAFFDFNLERDDDTITGISNIATGANASSSSLTSVTGSPKVVRTWDVSTSGSDTILTFERTVLTAQGGWRVPAGVSSAETMVVGGGGGGGYNTGGGGGGGGVEYSISTTLTSGSTMTVVVGQGGQGSTASSSDGANGTFSQLGTTVVGGGGGGASWASSGADGADAPTGSPAFTQNGSGGGASNANGAGGTGATDGGDGVSNAGGGGGGADQDGSDASSSTSGGGGGFGIARANLTGSLNQYGSGGGGGSWNNEGSKASGGSGAGDGGNANSAASHGTHHRGGGGGGGGSGSNKDGGNGGSGIVIVRFASVDHNDWSVATWFNASSLQGSTIIGTYDDNGQASDIGWALRIRAANGNLYSTVGPSSNTSAAWTSDASIDTDRWYHVVMVADVGNTLRLYLDGVNVANGSLSGSGDLRDVSNNVFLGSYNGGEEDQPFDGQIGSVMAFADALNASNINQLYTSGKGVYSNTTNLSYAQSSSTLLLGQTYSFPITVANGEVTTSYSLTGTLPSGMNFESSNGTIWGTPTVTMTNTTYTVTANNSAGSYSTSISLTSQHVAPYDLVYSPENMTLEKGTAMTTNTPSVSGGTVTSWAISPILPSGLAFSTSTGAISGTPTVLQTIATTYTIWANNSGGSASAQVNITINDEAPDIAYSPDWFVLTNNTAMQATTPTNSGGAIPSGVIGSGGPTTTSIAVDSYGHKHVSYRGKNIGGLKYATDASGSWVVTTVDTASAAGYYSSIAIDSNDVLHISYFDDTNKDLKYATCSSNCTTASNWNKVSVDTSNNVGYYTSIAIDSNDAVHISHFDDTNKHPKYATCSSGCTTASNWDNVQVETSGSGGYFTSIAIDSNDAVHMSYFRWTNSEFKYATCSSGCTMTSNWNTVSFDSVGSLGTGHNPSMAIDSNDGVHVSYFDATNNDLKYATCSSGCTTASNWNKVSVDTTGDVGYHSSIGIDSNDAVHISYFDETNDDLKYATCSSGCTTASNWNNESVDSIGLTGYYTSIAIDTNDVIHISYFDDTNNKIKYLALDSSSNILGYSVSPDLPEGLTFDPMIGKISGTPTELSTNTTYTITVRNSGGVNTTTITMLVNDQVPNALGYTPENMTLEKGTTMTTNTPSVSGGAVTSWDIDPSLPSGLSFGSTNGSIWGTPTVLQTTAATYTIWANNSGGSASAQVNITINDQIASISYSSPVDISNNRPLTATITPTTSGGAITSWEITPALPTGLTFGTTNGSIWGTPENVTSNATYTIYANNSGGSASATLTLNMNWTLTPSVDGAYITRNSSIGTDITWEWDYDPLEAIYEGLVTGEWNTCAIDDNGDVFCWGRNGNGQIGNNQVGTSACGTSGHKCKDIPTRTDDLGSDVVALAFGHQHACGLTDAGTVKCWGRNNNGQIGVSGGDVKTPYGVSLGSGRTATSIYAGGHSTCAILDDGSTKCWGHNSNGQLGIGSTSNTNIPTTINSLGSGRTAVSLAMAMHSVCALLDDGSVKCWGDDSQGQLGNGGSNVDINSPPASAINLGSGRTAKTITAGEYHFCAILDDNSITCWGEGLNGKLGTGSTSDRSTPTAVSGSFASGRYAVYLDAGYDHTCAILDNGDLTCWGSDAKGQLGNGAGSSSDVSSLSTSVISLGSGRTAISVSAGGTHTCAQLDNGQLKCWGNRADGQVGDNGGFNSPSDRTSPSTVSNNNYGGNTYADTGVFPSAAVTGATCGISPALPTGMSLTSGTCAITGTPTVTAVNATYTVWANISGLSFSGQVWLEVGLNAPILSYSPTSYLFVNGTTISEIQPINTGGEISGFEISPELPNGLSIGSTNGTIWGTPTVASALTSYTIWGNNSAGSSSTTLSIEVETTPTSLSYDMENMTLTKGLAMTTNTATVGGGTPTSWAISPSLPSGLFFSTNTGDISGTPTVLQTSAVTYTVWANNTAGSINTSLNITINDVAPNSVVYSPENMSFTNNSAITTTTPTASGGAVTSWEISPALPSGLSFGSTNGSIWGTPTVEQASTTYTVWANNSGGSSSGSINITVGPMAPGDFEYIPEDNVLFNDSYAHLAPSFVNITTGNGTTWQVGTSDTGPGSNFAFNINGTVYFNAGSNEKLWAYSPGNNSSWKVNNTVTWVGEHMAYAVEDTIYFSGHKGSTGREFYAYNTTNNTIWLVSDILSGSNNGNPGQNQPYPAQDGDVLFFKAKPTNSQRYWYTYNHSNGTLTELNQGWSASGAFSEVIGDILYMRGTVGNGHAEVWAYSAVNATAWMIEDIYSGSASSGSEAGEYLHTVVNDILLFDAWSGASNDPRSIWAYNPANATAWELQSADSTLGDSHVTTSSTNCGQPLVVGDVAYFCATGGSNAGGYELWAYNTSNETTWLVTDIHPSGDSHPGKHIFEVLGDTLYFSAADGNTGIEMWAYDTSNHSTWRVADINSGNFHSNPGQYMTVVFGDTLYFSAKTEATNQELFAYDTSNQSLWLVEDIRAGSQSSFVGEKMALVAGNKLVFNAKPSGTTSYLYGHEPSQINWMTNTGGNVTTWAINNTNLPTGLTFSTSNGTVYGTPTQLWSKTAYMVWANNSGGSSVGYLNITVMDANLSYSKYDLTLTKDQASNDLPLNATTTAPGTVTAWEISSALPAGLNFGTTNGTVWGVPTVLQTTATTYTIWANGTQGSVSASITLTIYDNAPGPFEYEPENNTWTNNTDVHLAPVFINRTTGNGSTWQVADINNGQSSSHSAPGQNIHILVGDTIYFDAFEAATGTELWAYDTSNQSLWRVTDIRSGSGGSNPGEYSSILVGDTLYFSANDGSTGQELWAHNTSNHSTWQVEDIRSGSNTGSPGSNMMHVINGVLYFDATDGNLGKELWKHDPSTDTTSRVKDIHAGSSGSVTGKWINMVVGDVLYFSATDGSTGSELWAYNTSNSSDPWRVMDIKSGNTGSEPGMYMSVLVGDTIYFDAGATGGRELWAHNNSNQSTWRVVDIDTGSIGSNPGQRMALLVGDTIYFDADDGSTGSELWAHDTSNHSTWQVADIYVSAGSTPGSYMSILVGDTVYFSAFNSITGHELWAHDTSNHSTWQVADINPYLTMGGGESSNPGHYMAVSVGDTVYFSANDGSTGTELWAHDTSNRSTWKVVDIDSGLNGGAPGYWMEILAGDTLFFSADDGSTGHELWAHRPSRIDENTNTGGAVTSWAINASLPSGVSFGTNNGTIYGTPTQLWTQTSYMVWANNSGGSTVAYLNITVNDVAPVISYSTTEITGTKDVAISPHVGPTTSGGTITSWEISPDPGSAFHFNTGNGYISGTPSILLSRTQYTIWANNSGGSSVAYVNVTINDAAPSALQYSPENMTLQKGTTMTTNTPSVSGGTVTSWEINATLPAGLNFGTTNGSIWGTPTVLQTTATTYTIWANNTGGSSSATINITVVDEVPTLSYSPSTLVLTKGNQSSDLPLNATLTGSGTITSWAINATLPAGLNFGTNNGTIWGIPTVLQTTATTYTIWANNTGGSTSATVTITINDEAPGPFEYNPENNTLTNNTYVHLEPDFINITTGNGSSWSAPAGTFMPWASFCLHHVYNGTLYTAATNGSGTSPKFYGYGLDNETAWVINSTLSSPGCEPVSYGMAGSGWEETFSIAHGTSLYFEAEEGNWEGLFGYGLENSTLWRQSSTELEITSGFTLAFEDILYFGAYHNSSVGQAMHAHNLSNGTTWLVIDASSGNTIPTYIGGGGSIGTVGDVFLYQNFVNNYALWAYNTSNGSAWAISSNAISSGGPVLDGVLYYSRGTHSSHRSLYAYNVSNETSWQVHSRSGVNSIRELGGVLYYDAASTTHSGDSLWAHNPDNGTTWEIEGSDATNIFLGLVAGGTLFYRTSSSSTSGLWAYDPSNTTAWQIPNATTNGDTFTSLGNTVYFTSDTTPASGEHDLWAYNTANETTWFVTNISASNWGFGTNPYPNSNPTSTSLVFAGDTLYIREGGGMRSHQPASINYQTNTGGNVTTWAINASLPSGLTFSTTNGSIYGTPTELWTQTSYMVWANNSGGSTVAYLNITVVDELPTLSYSPSTLVLTINTSSTDLPLDATLTGSGTITSWAISPALPSGLSFGTSNGTIWGTPTSLMTLKTFTIWANNSGGSSSATVNITVNDAAPDISYNPDWFVLTNNTAMSPTATPTNAGGAILSGIVDSNGDVGEHASIAIDSNGYKHISYYDAINDDLKYATDTSGSWVTISVDTTGNVGLYTSIAIDSNGAVHISYNDNSNDDLKYATCSSGCTTSSNWDLVVVETTGNVGLYTSIAIDSNNAVHISYYAASNADLEYATCSSGCSSASNWDIVAVDTAGSVGRFSSIAIDSNDAVHISYTDDGTADLKYATCSSGCSTASNWNNVSVDTNGSVGYYTSIAIDSNDAVHISYFASSVDDLKYATCSSGCSSASNWDIVSVDTTGDMGRYSSIAIDSNDAVHISYAGTASTSGSTPDLKYAACSSGCSTASNWNNVSVDTNGSVGYYTSIAIDSNDAVHISHYGITTDDLKYIALDSSSNIYGYSVSPDLPAGLNFNAFTGEISGTPTELSTNTTYTITVRNSGGTDTTTITIEVLDQLPTLSYSPENLTMTKGQSSIDLPLNATLTGSGIITSWEINATLPAGLNFGTNNGTIWGVPTVLQTTATTYTIWANNTGGSASATINITINDEAPGPFEYIPENNTWTNNSYVNIGPSFINQANTGGNVTAWAINASLPSGLFFGTNNGTIYGTPTELWPQTSYMVWANNSGGSSMAYINITVIDQLPTIAYSPTDITLTNNTASTDLPLVPTLTGPGEIISWAINASLPAGLTFETSNGTIWGTPTELWNTTAYTVWANNSGGSSVAYLNFTVIDQLPTSVTYTPENLTLTRDEVSTDLPLVPALTGPGDITSWAINASLPTGLSFGTNNGTIWGVPQVNMTTTAYTIWANNTGGSISTIINITVLEPVVILDYNPENLTLIRGVQMATLFPSVSGGNVSNWSISPDLPAGLNFSDGVISGTPTVNMTLSIFTVWANTSGGAASHTVNITILEPSGNLSYSPDNITLTRGVAMSDLHPTYNGGSIENWSIHPALPEGLNFSNGIISGTPTVNLTASMFTIYANNSGGSAAATINITILEPVVDLVYSPDNLTLMRGTTMQPLHPTVSGGNASEWALVGVLPEGLNFSNGVFSGTPLVNMTQTQYLVYANTTGGSATAWVNITVLEPAVDLSYNPHNITLIRNETMSPLSPTVSGGNVSIWSITPALPDGLNFTDGVISGTPEVNMTTTMFTVWANTSGGASSTTVNITILEPAVDFIYNPNSLVLTRNESMNTTSPVFGNSALAEEWGISPSLPEGLNFTNGTISGTPLVNMTATVFTVYANNTGGTGVAYLTITVLEPVATVVYVPENITLTRGEDNASIVPILGGGMVASWSISPELPEGMVFDNGSITGVPLVNSTNTTYTVMALNSGGMAFAFLNITVVEPVAILAFNESFLGTRGETLFNATVNNTGGMVATWEIEPALPEGVGLWNGWLWGTPSVNLSETTFTVWANNSGGSANITFTLEVIEPVVIIDYPEAEIVLVNGVTRGRIIPVLSGGVADNWSIEPALPPGLTFVNGYIIGLATTNLSQTTYTVWANNSGGSASATFNLTVNQPTFYARYPTTRVVLDVNETMPTLAPLYYFGDNQNPTWKISPALPEGLVFENGRISGTPTEPSNETNYTITVTGEMVPVELSVLIEVRAEANLTVESVRNETVVEQFVLPEPPEEESFDMYWICFPLILILTLLGAAAINNFLALAKDDDEDEDDAENEGKDDEDGGDEGGG